MAFTLFCHFSFLPIYPCYSKNGEIKVKATCWEALKEMILFKKIMMKFCYFAKKIIWEKIGKKKLPPKKKPLFLQITLFFYFFKVTRVIITNVFFFFFSCFFSEFVRHVGWLPSTRGLGQIWLQLREESRKVWELCDIMATYYNLLFLKMAILFQFSS
jgi:hypothetical protein